VPARYVLDASAGVDILERTPEGQVLSTVLRATGDDEPELWTVEHFHLEVAKVLRRDTLTGVLDDQRATQLIDVLADWPLTVVSVAPLLVEAWQLRNNLTVHDALYVVATRAVSMAPPSSPPTGNCPTPPAWTSPSSPPTNSAEPPFPGRRAAHVPPKRARS
jgi:predicted nucleic acid-binding protein